VISRCHLLQSLGLIGNRTAGKQDVAAAAEGHRVMVDPVAVRQLLEERLAGILRADLAETGGGADEVAARLLTHPVFKAALEELQASMGNKAPAPNYSRTPSASSVDKHDRPRTLPGAEDENRPKTVVWTFSDDEDDTNHGGLSSDGSGSSNGGRSTHDPFSRDEWGGGGSDDSAALQRLAAELAGSGVTGGLGLQRMRSLAELANHQASDVLCDQYWPVVLQSLGACLIDDDAPARSAAANELCRLFGAAVPGALAFEIVSTLGTACKESLHRPVPLSELAGRVHLYTRALVAVSSNWEELSGGNSQKSAHC